MTRWEFTSESVTEGHPDKMADQISDTILDAMLAQDPMSRVACETMLTTGLAIVAGEITTKAYVDIASTVRQTINKIGYDRESFGFDGNTCGVMVTIDEQSPDIAVGVDKQGAGDQGMMFGYACDETTDLMPQPIHLAHRLAERHAEIRKAGTIPYWVRCENAGHIRIRKSPTRRLKTVLISAQHSDGIDRDSMIRPDIWEHIVAPVLPDEFAADNPNFYVNPTGRFVTGGPVGDTGLPDARLS